MADLPRNDRRQYDDLVDQWWRPDGAFAALHWLAAARAAHLPAPARPGAVLVDLACGGGLMAPHAGGYRHVGVDLVGSALRVAREQGVTVVQGDVTALPLRDGVADVVVAGEMFEHVADLAACVREAARVLRPGGLVICDTIADTAWARLAMVAVSERLPGGPPPRIHDPGLFVSPDRLRRLFDRHGVALRTHGISPAPLDYLRFLADRRRPVRMRANRWSAAAVYAGIGWKRQEQRRRDRQSTS